MDLTFSKDCATIKYTMNETAPNQNPPNSKAHVFTVYLSLALMAAIIAIGGYFLGLNQSVGKKRAETTTAKPQAKQPEAAGLQKAQNAMQNYKGFITQTRIVQTYNGVLKTMVVDKSFTLEKGGKAVTLRNDNNKKVGYFIRRDEPNAKLNPTTVDNIKTGNNVLVIVSFNALNAAKTDVERVVLVLPAAPASNAASTKSDLASPSAQ